MGDGTFALLDSFGPEEMRPTDTCGAWVKGQTDGDLFVGDVATTQKGDV